MDKKQEPLTEQRVVEIVLIEMGQYVKAMSKSVAHAIALNNAKVTAQLKGLGVIKEKENNHV